MVVKFVAIPRAPQVNMPWAPADRGPEVFLTRYFWTRWDTHLDGALDNIEESILATCVTLSAPKTALPGPTSVAVHDDGDVVGDEFRWQLGWTSSRRMRQRAALRGSRCDSGHGSQRSGVEDGSGAGLVPS